MRAAIRTILLGGLDPDALAWSRTVTVSSARLRLVSSTIRALKQAGVWPLLDRLWVTAAENSMQGRTCWKTRTTLSLINSPAFTANRGITGDGATSYADTGLNLATAGGQFGLNSASLFTYLNTTRAAASSVFSVGTYNGVESAYISPRISGNLGDAGLNTGGTSSNGSVSDTLGLLTVSRTSGSLTTLYKRAASLGTSAAAATTVPTNSLYFLAFNGGTPFGLETVRMAAGGIGGGLTTAQVTALNTILESNILTPIGASA